MILEIVFIVCTLLSLIGAVPAAEPYRPYSYLLLVIAVICLGLRVFSIHA